MPSSTAEPIAAITSHKKEKKSKKRNRDLDGELEADRKHKKSKSMAKTEEDNAVDIKATPAVDTELDGDGKKEKKKKKRPRHSEAGAESQLADDAAMPDATTSDLRAKAEEVPDTDAAKIEKKKKKKDKRRNSIAEPIETPPAAVDDVNVEVTIEENKSKKHKKKHQNSDVNESQEVEVVGVVQEAEKKKKKRNRKEKHEDTINTPTATMYTDAMDIDSPAKAPKSQAFGSSAEKPYPFFTQTISLYLPLFPSGMIEPVEGFADQHLKPLLNRYVPNLKGVLLAYRNPRVGERPGKGSLTEKSEGTADEAMLESVDEYAVVFGWLTVEVDIFKPARGAWLEGAINLQSEGHLGVVCWEMFNASIEAARLPQGWQWVDLMSDKGSTKTRAKHITFEDEAQLPTPESANEDEDEVAAVPDNDADVDGDVTQTQLHTTGYWVDEKGQKVRGKLRFRVKNYEVGVSGDYGYLSIEGTMLDEEAEKQKVTDEMEHLRQRKLKGARSFHKRLPEFSMTKFGADEEQEDESKRAEVWKGSQPANETAE
ncbi:uncharacterized protein BCR38DRAFT_424612 [Pseudomassariella vexata]|uniref:DNA-directed RNA polymerase subunit n=1 Tax=Pseudomassariella vexata TaxID=1141098 RepID=A0A1Y2EBF2_9PEZI|nr:uncharacterized protein BCR38DRAFT_424612 [Pseudomassariella vexata]ORY68891.1 hypothetical protein BCR38DRAFT_424612 [Pseudomassariella vexata]